MGHYITKCKVCGKVIASCRCMCEPKKINYIVCNECEKINNGLAPAGIVSKMGNLKYVGVHTAQDTQANRDKINELIEQVNYLTTISKGI